jgi:hypothetical protein
LAAARRLLSTANLMHRLSLALVLLLVSQSAWADVSLRPPELRVRRHLVGVSAVLAVLGGGLAASDVPTEVRAPAIALGSGAWLTATFALASAAYRAGYEEALHTVAKLPFDVVEDVASERERIGMTVTLGGVGALAVGVFLAAIGSDAVTGGPHADALRDTFTAGAVLSGIGALAASAGSVLWSYGAGLVRGVRQQHARLAFAPTGIGVVF